MKVDLISLTYEIELAPGEILSLPESLRRSLGPGRWRLTIEPADDKDGLSSIRDHRAFLNSYVAEDEGLYDDHSSR